MLNETFGNLTVISEPIKMHNGKRYRTYRECVCSCGTKTTIREDNLKSGNTQNCGCMQKIPSAIQKNLNNRVEDLESKIEKYEKLISKTLELLSNESISNEYELEQIHSELAMSFGEIRNK